MNKRISITFLFYFLVIVLLNSCSSFLYYPNRYLYTQPKKLPFHPSEELIALDQNVTLHGWHFSNEARAEKACVVFFHGNGQNRSAHFVHLYWLVEYGFDFFIFDYPGYGQSNGEPSPKSTVQAAIAVIERVSQSCNKIAVYGHSLGGQIAMRAVWELRNKLTPDLLIVDSTFLSYQEVSSKILQKSIITWLFSPLAYILISDSYAIGNKLQDLQNIPLVVIHSKKDEIIPFELGKNVFESAKNDKQFWIKNSGGHQETFSDSEGKDLQKKLLKLLEQKLTFVFSKLKLEA